MTERFGWKRLQDYNLDQRLWKYLSNLAEGNAGHHDDIPSEDELGEEDYSPSLPFAALFSCFKVAFTETSLYSIMNIS